MTTKTAKKLSKRDYGLLVSLIQRERENRKRKGTASHKGTARKKGNKAKKGNKTKTTSTKNHKSPKYNTYLKKVRSIVSEHTKYSKLPVGTQKRIRRSYITAEDVKRMKKLGIPTASIDRVFPSVHGNRRYRSDKVYKSRSKGKRVEETINKALKTNKRASTVAKTRETVMNSRLPAGEKEKLLTDLERKAREEYRKGYDYGVKHGKREYNRSLNSGDKNLAEQINTLFS